MLNPIPAFPPRVVARDRFVVSARRPRPTRAAAIACAATLVLTVPGEAVGQTVLGKAIEPVRFSLVRREGAESCPAAQDIDRRVTASLGRNPFSLDAPYELEGEVDHTGKRWFAVLTLRGRNGEAIGERRLETAGDSCDAMARAMVLAIALTIDPQSPPRAEPTPVAPAAGEDPPDSSVPAAPPASVPPRPRPAVSTVSARASAAEAIPPVWLPGDDPVGKRRLGNDLVRLTPAVGVAWGVLPGTAVGAGLAAVAPFDSHVSGGIGMFWLSEQRTDQGRFGFGLTTGELVLCYRFEIAAGAETSSCLLAQAGSMHATAYADEPLDPGQKLWLAAGAGQQMAFEVANRVLVDVGVDVLAPVVRHDFRIVGAQGQSVFLPRPVTAIGRVGLSVSFP